MTALLQVNNVKVHYPIRGGFFKSIVDYTRAVDGISFDIQPGETYGLVGESGCGKTTMGRSIMGLNPVTSGEILYEGTDLTRLNGRERRNYVQSIQMIFQDPYASLNGRKRVLDIVAEPLRNFKRLSADEEREQVEALIRRVGLGAEALDKYPHAFSGGQRQRIGIARALALQPQLIIADEPVSALDVSVQAQVLNFMQAIQREFQLSYLFISHDLGVIQHICDRVGIMHRGRLVEEGTVDEIYHRPQHIYTKRLLSAIPEMDPAKRLEKARLRRLLDEQYDTECDQYFDCRGRIFDLKKISATHSVALP